MKRVAAAVTEGELPCRGSARRASEACRVGRGLERSESDRPAPDHESDERELESSADRGAVLPEQRKE